MRRNPDAKQAFMLKATGMAGLVIAIDMAFKEFVRRNLSSCHAPSMDACDRLHVLGHLQLVRLENAGSAFGLYQGQAIWTAVAALGLLLIFIYSRQFFQRGAVLIVAAGLQAGGALGNLFDRLIYGRVTDWINLGGSLAFNIADVALALGMVLALLVLLLPGRTEKLLQTDTDAATDSA